MKTRTVLQLSFQMSWRRSLRYHLNTLSIHLVATPVRMCEKCVLLCDFSGVDDSDRLDQRDCIYD